VFGMWNVTMTTTGSNVDPQWRNKALDRQAIQWDSVKPKNAYPQ